MQWRWSWKPRVNDACSRALSRRLKARCWRMLTTIISFWPRTLFLFLNVCAVLQNICLPPAFYNNKLPSNYKFSERICTKKPTCLCHASTTLSVHPLNTLCLVPQGTRLIQFFELTRRILEACYLGWTSFWWIPSQQPSWKRLHRILWYSTGSPCYPGRDIVHDDIKGKFY